MVLQMVEDRFNYFRQHRFVKSVAFLQTASIIGNFAQSLIGVFIARLLQPENFGLYAIATSLAALVFISTGVQETVTVILGETYTKNDRDATVTALAFFLRFTIIFSLITLIIALFLPEMGKVFYHNSQVGVYAAIIIIAAVFSSFAFSMATMILQVAGDIKHMAMLVLADQVTRFAFSLVLVWLGFGILGAALGHLIGAVLIFVISIVIWRSVVRKYSIFPSWSELFHKIRRLGQRQYLNFSLWVAVDKNLAGLYGIFPVLLVGAFLSHSEVAFFKLALGYIGLALSLLGPISTLLNFEFSKMKVEDPTKVRANFIRVSLYSMGVSTILTLGTIVTAPFVFKILYGSNFLPSIRYVSYLFVYGALFGIGVGLGPMWRAINKVKVSILINVVVLGLGIPLGLWLIKNFGLTGAVVMITLWYTVSHFVSFLYLSSHLEKGPDPFFVD